MRTDQKEIFEEVYGFRSWVCAGVLDRWVQKGLGIPIVWSDIMSASWVLWPDRRSLMLLMLVWREHDLETKYTLLVEEVERGEDVLAFEGYSPALWCLVVEARNLISDIEGAGFDECFSE